LESEKNKAVRSAFCLVLRKSLFVKTLGNKNDVSRELYEVKVRCQCMGRTHVVNRSRDKWLPHITKYLTVMVIYYIVLCAYHLAEHRYSLE